MVVVVFLLVMLQRCRADVSLLQRSREWKAARWGGSVKYFHIIKSSPCGVVIFVHRELELKSSRGWANLLCVRTCFGRFCVM